MNLLLYYSKLIVSARYNFTNHAGRSLCSNTTCIAFYFYTDYRHLWVLLVTEEQLYRCCTTLMEKLMAWMSSTSLESMTVNIAFLNLHLFYWDYFKLSSLLLITSNRNDIIVMYYFAALITLYVRHRRVFSDASTSWLKFLGEKKIPVIMCLTFGDHLYFEVEERQKQKSKEPTETSEDIKRIIAAELYVKKSLQFHHRNILSIFV